MSVVQAQRLGMEMIFLGVESAAVIALRTAKLIQGGPAAAKEANDMVAEKVAALAELPLVLGGMPSSPAAAARTVVGHFGRKVSANRRRLSASPIKKR